jgi:hypothetical protein
LFDEELVPEELTQVRMGKIVGTKFPELDAEDQEAVRQHAVAALNLTQKAKEIALSTFDDTIAKGNTALIDGVRKFAMDVRELDIDLIDRINPFGEAYAVLAKTMSEESLKEIAAVISSKKVQLTPEEARDLARRAVKFKQERGTTKHPLTLGKEDGRGCRLSGSHEAGGIKWLESLPRTMMLCLRNSASRLKRKKEAIEHLAKSALLPVLKKYSVLPRVMGSPHNTETSVISSNGFTLSGLTGFVSYRNAANWLRRWTIRGY